MWNYRIVKEITEKETFYSIRDVYYNNKGEPDSWGAEPQYPVGEDLDDFKSDIDNFTEALKKPILVVKGDKIIKE